MHDKQIRSSLLSCGSFFVSHSNTVSKVLRFFRQMICLIFELVLSRGDN